MTFDTTLIQPCGDGWCVNTANGLEGPLETANDATSYAILLNRVSAARNELVSTNNNLQKFLI